MSVHIGISVEDFRNVDIMRGYSDEELRIYVIPTLLREMDARDAEIARLNDLNDALVADGWHTADDNAKAEIERLRAVEQAARNVLQNYDEAFARNRVVTPLSFLGIVTLRNTLETK